jgi:glucose/arabinose dehydrogenase
MRGAFTFPFRAVYNDDLPVKKGQERMQRAGWVFMAGVLLGAASADTVSFPDAGLESAVREAAGVPAPAPLTSADVEGIHFLDASYRGITDLTGLPALTQLDTLFLFGNEQLEDISLLAEIPTLYKLFLFGCEVSDLSPLENLVVLHELRFELNDVADLAPLSGLVNLRLLGASHNRIATIDTLAGLVNMSELYLNGNQISAIDVLRLMPELTVVDLSGNAVEDIAPLEGLTKLRELNLSDNRIKNIAPLVADTGLGEGDVVDLRRNPLDAAAFQQHIPALQARGVTVRYDDREAEGDYSLRTAVVATGLDRPLFATSPPGETERLFVLEQVSGRVRIVKNGQVLPTAFLDLGGKVHVAGHEQGLLGMAFHPDYDVNGYFFVSYTGEGGASVVERYRVSANPDVADAASGQAVFGPVPQPFSDHKAGMLAFGPDGLLYFSLGDGGGVGDPGNRAQDLDVPHGKILRLDVDHGVPAIAPQSNPFHARGGASAFVWAYGFRNPWRFSFDRLTGDLYIGDVGQSTREEISFEAAGSPGGANYGWKLLEGTEPFACPAPLSEQDCTILRGETVPPIFEYGHEEGQCVTGGYVYRGAAIPSLAGAYVFGDFTTGRVWTFRFGGINATDLQDRTAELTPSGDKAVGNVASFGEDGAGELYIVDYSGGRVLKVLARTPGDIDGGGMIDAVDVQLVVNAVLGISIHPYRADPVRNGVADAADVQSIVNAILGV